MAGCDTRVTKKVEFLQHPRAERSPYLSHFRLQFAEGMVPFEVNRYAREILTTIADLLTPCGTRA